MLKLALRNILRHKLRTAMTLAAIVFGVVGLILSGGFVEDIFLQLAETTIHSQSGHLQIYKTGFFAQGSRAPEKYLIDEPDSIRSALDRFPEIDDTMARVNFSGLLNNGRTDLSIVGEGVEADKEARLGSHLKISAGRQLGKADAYGILVGHGVAASLKLIPGERVTLLLNTAEGAMNSLEFEVVGVFQTFSKEFDARAVRIPLAAAQELLNTQGINRIVLSLKKTEDTERVTRSLAAQLDGALYELKTWRQLNDFYQKTVDLYARQFGVLRLIVLIMVFLGVANTINMSVFERTGEFGTMMALGNTRMTIFQLVLLENVLLGLIGASVGALLGVALAVLISTVGIVMPPPPNANIGYTALIRIVPSVVVMAFLVGLIATILAAIFPASRVARTPIDEALRQNV
ncbi:MAG: ABC transporter permease [Candidatus Accumulibacter sp.]|jgi:putative ABC transport system permease protein|uniref:ABC transporter permease n=1 Tax=Candidatus Accumulibacter TaxID=327159 RepID=UPI001AC113DA|nr:ABC transporter permease [Accumulibacter sp.]MBK8115711.1 ABC transporter permease [Accumulibacter sp.]MBK8579459.1 ABC transporter permease [Candidatus Accumulibacter propinquus]MBN8439568.1 ABC transporter permease [Accumulibacter sp.]